VYCLDLIRGKAPRSREGILVGYSDECKGYRIWLPDAGKVVISRSVKFAKDPNLRLNVDRGFGSKDDASRDARCSRTEGHEFVDLLDLDHKGSDEVNEDPEDQLETYHEVPPEDFHMDQREDSFGNDVDLGSSPREPLTWSSCARTRTKTTLDHPNGSTKAFVDYSTKPHNTSTLQNHNPAFWRKYRCDLLLPAPILTNGRSPWLTSYIYVTLSKTTHGSSWNVPTALLLSAAT